MRIWITLYSLTYTFLLIPWLVSALYRYLAEGKRVHLKQRMTLPKSLRRLPSAPGVSRIWIHAVSVGEVNSIRPLADALNLTSSQLFISTTTDTGQALACQLFQDRAHIFFFPLDWGWLCRRYLRAIRPSVILIAETEIWPGFITSAAVLGVPIVIVNGRISDRSFRRYRRVRRPMQPILDRVQRFCMQSNQDKKRMLELGAQKGRVHWIGNLKYDYGLPPSEEQLAVVELARRLLQKSPEDLIWVCGSTREGEEELLLGTYIQLRQDFPQLRLLMAPRHLRRSEVIEHLLQDRALPYARRSDFDLLSQEELLQQECDVLILDSIGELPFFYELGDIIFVGGSLVATGGHNIIEAAYFGRPVLVGPHMENFREIADTFLQAYGALQVQEPEQLEEKIRDLLRDAKAREWLGRNARKVIRDNQGAVQRTLEIVEQYLDRSGSATSL